LPKKERVEKEQKIILTVVLYVYFREGKEVVEFPFEPKEGRRS
jgi:hypothetical protein